MNFILTKKEAIQNLKQKANELADKGDYVGVVMCIAQMKVIRATNTLKKNRVIL